METLPKLRDGSLRLATRLRAELRDSDRVVLVVGPSGADGASPVAVQFALAFAHMNEGSILIVDANLRRPSLHEAFDIKVGPGLTDVVTGKVSADQAIVRPGSGALHCIPAGYHADDPVTLFTLPTFSELLDDLRNRFRLVIVDSSPMLTFPESALVALRTDRVVLVAAAGRRRSGVAEAKAMVEMLRVELAGVVLTERE